MSGDALLGWIVLTCATFMAPGLGKVIGKSVNAIASALRRSAP